MAAPARLKICVDSSVELGPNAIRRFIIGAPSDPEARVADVAATLGARLAQADARLRLAVDGFALLASERLSDVVREGDVLAVRRCTDDAGPAAKRTRGEAGVLALGDRLCQEEARHQREAAEAVSSLPMPSEKGATRSAPMSIPLAADGTRRELSSAEAVRRELSSAEAVRQAQDALRAMVPKARPRADAGDAVVDDAAKTSARAALEAAKTSAMAAVGPVTPRTHTGGSGVTSATVSKAIHADAPRYTGVGPASLSHQILGDLEVPAGLDTDTFVQRKLRRLGCAIRKQVEHYFGDANLARDEHLQSLTDAEGYVPMNEVVEFERLKRLASDVGFITQCLAASECLEVSPGGDRVRRRV